MKRIISVILLFALVVSVLVLTSCESPDELGFVYEENLAGSDVVSLEDGLNFKIGIRNKDNAYERAKLKIRIPELFTDPGRTLDESNSFVIEYDDFEKEEYSDFVCETYHWEYIGDAGNLGSITGIQDFEGLFIGGIKYELILFKEGDLKGKTISCYSFPFISDGENIVFCEYLGDCYESYYNASKRLPSFNPLVVEDRNELDVSQGETGPLVDERHVVMEAELQTVERVPIGEPFDITVGVGHESAFLTGYFKVLADGFTMSDTDVDDTENEFVKTYDDFNPDKFEVKSGGYGYGKGTRIYGRPIFRHYEHISLVSSDISERSGKILLQAHGESSENPKLNGGSRITLYYATDGKYIAYSVDSEDAAKHALYGESGYFWRVTVPEFFNGLFDGCGDSENDDL